ncbi:MAG: hypothetical protein WAL99_23470 [Pseudonocardiaceae bacterium]
MTEKDVRYTVTITEYDGDGYDTAARVVRSTSHTGEAVEVLAAAVEQRNNPAEPGIDIYRGSQGVKVDLAELVEVARVGATTPQTRRLWVDAMVTLIRGWVYPWDDASPLHPPPDQYWQQAGRWWSKLVKIPPPEDLMTALAEYPDLRDLSGHTIFANRAQHLTTTPVVTSAVRRASAALAPTAATPGITPRWPTAPLTPSPHESPQRGQARGR